MALNVASKKQRVANAQNRVEPALPHATYQGAVLSHPFSDVLTQPPSMGSRNLSLPRVRLTRKLSRTKR